MCFVSSRWCHYVNHRCWSPILKYTFPSIPLPFLPFTLLNHLSITSTFVYLYICLIACSVCYSHTFSDVRQIDTCHLNSRSLLGRCYPTILAHENVGLHPPEDSSCKLESSLGFMISCYTSGLAVVENSISNSHSLNLKENFWHVRQSFCTVLWKSICFPIKQRLILHCFSMMTSFIKKKTCL